jgi:hypothetical protein
MGTLRCLQTNTTVLSRTSALFAIYRGFAEIFGPSARVMASCDQLDDLTGSRILLWSR